MGTILYYVNCLFQYAFVGNAAGETAKTITGAPTGITAVTIPAGAESWIHQAIDVVTENPLVLVFVVAVPLVGLGVGLLSRLISTRG